MVFCGKTVYNCALLALICVLVWLCVVFAVNPDHFLWFKFFTHVVLKHIK